MKSTILKNLNKTKILYRSTWSLSVHRIGRTSIILISTPNLAAKKNSEQTVSQILLMESISYLRKSLLKIEVNISLSVLNKQVMIVTADIARIYKKIRRHSCITNHRWFSADQKHQYRLHTRSSWKITNHKSLAKI